MNIFKKWFTHSEANQENLPDYIKVCLEQCASGKAMLKKNFEDVRFVVLDTETTGLDTKKDEVLSIGAIAVKQKTIKVQDSFEIVLKNTCSTLDAETVEIHGLTLLIISDCSEK